MSNVPAPWMLYVVGAALSLILLLLKVPPLPFALGVYLPQELNTPLLAGGLVAWFVSTRSKDEKLNSARQSRGTLIASGFIAGGSLFGVIGAFLRFGDVDLLNAAWQESHGAEVLALGVFILLAAYLIWDSMRAKAE